MPRKPKFNGYDFSELGKAWGLEMSEEGLDDNADLKAIREYMLSEWSWDRNSLNPDVKRDMLKFLDALVKTGLSGYVPVYRAMKKLEDFEFVQVYCDMLPHMWT
jgi:hypothetical protein